MVLIDEIYNHQGVSCQLKIGHTKRLFVDIDKDGELLHGFYFNVEDTAAIIKKLQEFVNNEKIT